ncbi:hypothetical protein CAPTEDRAFT_210650 [Capitella teleta]|uniref:Uncharacterized protein n=1 Tax=Capitella teleta TaxID=283909 RepID=R7T4V9_CAPTE|nr:hypothetical protein CAPTEDRAFT_210650 [Capitella teleta]|eukprot:ELT88132.1 hypothetical protein CAPTEDRAFT_210650 [Capitella teleta]
MDPAIADSLDCDASEVSAEEDGAGEAEGATASTSAAAAPPVNEEDDDEVNRMEDGAEQIPDAEQEPEINIVIGPDEQMQQRDDEPPRNVPVRRRPKPPHTRRADEVKAQILTLSQERHHQKMRILHKKDQLMEAKLRAANNEAEY